MAFGGGRGPGRDEEKAYDSNNQDPRGRYVNSSFRPNHGASSRFTQQSFHSTRGGGHNDPTPHRQRSRSPYRDNRYRSRSPYRAPRNNAGEKRRHDGDHYNTNNSSDTRRVRAHYDDSASHSRPYSRDGSNTQYRGRDSGKYRNDPTSRNRSRSPFRHNRNGAKDERRGSMQDSTTSGDESRATDTAAAAVKPPSPTKEPTPEHEVVSETQLIEQRRKRREEIKAKHKLAQPLLVQALEQNIYTAPSTPVHDSSTASFNAQSPTSAADSPVPASPGSGTYSPVPFTAETMNDIINHNQTHDVVDEGPSAADYDPTMDMQEDRRDLQKPTTLAAPQPPPPTKAEFDMFGEDDDDMFAEADATHLAKSAKTLDRSLLDNWDYPDGHYRVIIGELLDGKYAVEQQIGKGTFATVVRAQNVATGAAVAVKIACNNDTMYKAGTKELDFLNILNDSDPEDRRHIIRLLGKFDHKGHLCLVFENMSADLRETLKKYGRNVGINLVALRSYAHQMFRALDHMRKNEILHADLKPDNILVTEKRNVIKICDFGTASLLKDAEITPYLVSRFYRAPEVMLGMPLDYAIDMWSVGCTLFELYTGRILFAGADNNQMLRAIQECRGKIPNRMLKKSTLFDHHFDQHGSFISIEQDKATGQQSLKQPNLSKIAVDKDLRHRLLASAKDTSPKFIKEMQSFVDLLERCLQLDPARRITPADALKHYFIVHGGKSEKIAALAPKIK